MDLRYDTQTTFLERLGLDQGVHISISSFSDPQTSSSASELTSFCTLSSALPSVEACLLRTFRWKNLVQDALYYLICDRVLHMPRMTPDEFLYLLRTPGHLHSLSNDRLAA